MSDDTGHDSDGDESAEPPADESVSDESADSEPGDDTPGGEGPAGEDPDDESNGAETSDDEEPGGEDPDGDSSDDESDGAEESDDEEPDDGEPDDEGLGEEWGPLDDDDVVQNAEALDIETDEPDEDSEDGGVDSGNSDENGGDGDEGGESGTQRDGESGEGGQDGESDDDADEDYDTDWGLEDDDDVLVGDEGIDTGTGDSEDGGAGEEESEEKVPYMGTSGVESGDTAGGESEPEHGPARSGEQRDTGRSERETRDTAAVGSETADPTTGAPDDEEMPLTQHIEEMVGRLLVVIAIMAAVAIVTLFYSDELINFLWYSFLDGPRSACPTPPTGAEDAVNPDCPNVYHPLALVLARLKVASLVGFIVALPAFVYETYLFMRPGLYPHERRYYLAAVPTSLVLAAIGVAFAYFAVLRSLFAYFISYSSRAADLAFGLTATFDLIILLLGFFALIFQIPLFIMLAIMMGVTTRQWLQDRRIYFWGGFAGIAFLFSPDPTGMAPVMVAATMIVLFEGTLLLLRWTGN